MFKYSEWTRRFGLEPKRSLASFAFLAGLSLAGPSHGQEQKVPSASELAERLTTAIGITPEVLPEGVRFLVHFDQDLNGLQAGAPVTVKGLRVGTVREVAVVIDSANATIDAPVVFDIVPDRITVDDGSLQDPNSVYALAKRLVADGLRAGIESLTPIGGPKRVTLSLVADAEPAELKEGGRYPEIPTAPSPAEELRASAEAFAARIEALPLEQMAEQLNVVLAELETLVSGPELRQALDALQRAAGSIEQAAGQSTNAISGLEQTIGPRSLLWDELLRTSQELAGTTRALRLLVEYLERHPDALIRGKPGNQP